jgi:hypothetical protein
VTAAEDDEELEFDAEMFAELAGNGLGADAALGTAAPAEAGVVVKEFDDNADVLAEPADDELDELVAWAMVPCKCCGCCCDRGGCCCCCCCRCCRCCHSCWLLCPGTAKSHELCASYRGDTPNKQPKTNLKSATGNSSKLSTHVRNRPGQQTHAPILN